MRPFITTFALAMTALVGFAPSTEAAEIEFEYQVHVADVPDYAVWMRKGYNRGHIESVHFDLEDADDRIEELEADGYTAWVQEFRPSKHWLYDNSEYVETFDNYDDAVDFAMAIEGKFGLHAWVKKVEVIPGGP